MWSTCEIDEFTITNAKALKPILPIKRNSVKYNNFLNELTKEMSNTTELSKEQHKKMNEMLFKMFKPKHVDQMDVMFSVKRSKYRPKKVAGRYTLF